MYIYLVAFQALCNNPGDFSVGKKNKSFAMWVNSGNSGAKELM